MAKQSVVGIGYDNYLDKNRFVAVLNISSSPAQRLAKRAEENGRLIDVTAGRKRKSLIITDSNYVFVTAKAPNTLSKLMEE